MDEFFFIYINIFSAIIIVAFLWLNIRRKKNKGLIISASFPTILISAWLLSSALWGAYFFNIKITGFFDISIERFMFILILITIFIGFYKGDINLSKGYFAIEICIVLFSSICIISMLMNGFSSKAPNFPSPFYIFINGYFIPFIVFFFAKHYLKEEKDIYFIFNLFFFLGAYCAVIAFLEFFEFRRFIIPRYITDPDIPLHLDRARGPLLNSAFNGVLLNIGFCCGLHLLLQKDNNTKIVYFILLALFPPAIFFTQTRSVYLGFFIILTMFGFFYKTSFPKWKLLAIPVAVCFILIMANMQRFASSDRKSGGVYQVEEVEIRLTLIKISMIMFLDNPFMGVGLARFNNTFIQNYQGRIPIPEDTDQTNMHNHIIGIMVEMGIFAIMVYLTVIAILFTRLYKIIKYLYNKSYLSNHMFVIIFIILCVYLSNNLFVDPSFCLFINSVFFAFAGIVDNHYFKFTAKIKG